MTVHIKSAKTFEEMQADTSQYVQCSRCGDKGQLIVNKTIKGQTCDFKYLKCRVCGSVMKIKQVTIQRHISDVKAPVPLSTFAIPDLIDD